MPVGVPLPGATAATVAENVTSWPNTDVDGDTVRIVLVPERVTVTDREAEVLGLKLPSPAYWATTTCVPTNSLLSVRVATPLAPALAEPMMFAPSLKLTVPVRVPEPGATGVTVAVNVTDWPKVADAADTVSAVAELATPTVTFADV